MAFKRCISAFLLLVLLIGVPVAVGAADGNGKQDMALRWDRDFDLLIDMEDVPTLAQKKQKQEKKILLAEKTSLKRKLADLDRRMAAVSGSFTNEALLEEMLRLKKRDAASVRKELRKRRAGLQRRIAEIDRSLKVLSEKGES